MYILEVNHGGGEIHRHFLLPGQTYTLGRKECRILLPAAEPSISRHHATITVAPMPRYSVLDPTAQLEIKIEDVSKHGTFVDRERVGKDNTRFLYPEDRIRLGLRVTARIIPMVLVIGISPDLTDENLDLVLDSAVHVGALVVEDAIPAPMTYYEQHANSVGFLYVAEDGFAMEETMMQALGYGYTLVTPTYIDHLVRALEEQDTLMPSEFPTPSSPSPGSMGLRAVHYRRPAQTFFSVTEFLSIGRPIVANVFERYTFLLLSETLREVYAAVLQLFGGVVEALTGDGAIAAWRAAHPQSGAYPQTTCVLVGEEDFRAVSEAVMERGSGRGDFDATHTHPTITGYLTLYKLGVCLIPEENVHLALYRSDSAELTTKATACYLQRTAEDVLADSSSSSATTPAPAASPHATAASVPASPPPPPAVPVAATASRDSLASSTDGTAAKPASFPAPATAAAAVVASPPAEGAAVAANPQHRRSLSNSHHSAAEPSATAPHPRPHAGVAHLTAVQARRSREAVHSPPASSSTSRERSTSKPSAAAALAAATASPSGTVHSPANPPVIALRSSASPKRAGSPDFSSQQQSPRGGGAAGGVPVTTVPALSSIVARAPSANGAAALEGAAEVRLSSTPVAPTALHLSRSGSNSGSGSFNAAADAAAGAKASPRAPSASPPAPAAATASGGSLASSMTRQPETDAAAPATTPAAATSREASATAPPPATSASSNQRSTPADTSAAHPHAANALSREPSESAAPPARGRLVGRRASHPFSLTNRLRHGESHPSSDDDNDENAEQPKAPSAPADGNGAAQESESPGATAAAAAHAQGKRASQPSARRASTSVRRGSLGAQPSPAILPLKSEEVVRPRTRTASGSQPSAYASAVAALGRRSAAQSEERQAEESAPRRSASTDPQAHGVPPLPPSGVATTATTAPLLHRAASRTSAASNSAATTNAGAAGKSGSGGAASPSSHASVRRGEQRLASASAPAPRRSLTRASAALASASRERSASPQQSRLKAKRLPSPEKDVVVHHATQVGKSPPRQRVEAVRITATPSSSARRMSVTREAEASVPRHGDPTASATTTTAAAAVPDEEAGPGSMGNRRSVVRRESVSRQGAMGGGPLTRRASSSFQRSDSAQLREMATPHRLTSRVSSSVPRTRRAKAYGSVQRQRSLEPAGEESAEAEGSPLNSSRVSIRRRRGSPTQSGATNNNNSATASGVFSLNVSASNGGGSSSGGGGGAVVPGQIPGLRGGSAAPMAGGASGATAEAHFRANDELNTNCQKFMKEFVDDFMTETERVTRSVVRQTYMDAASKETLEGGVERILEFLQYVNSTESDIPSMYSTSSTRAACHQVRQKSQYALSKIKACYKTVSCKIPSSLTRARAALSTRNVSPTQRRLHAASGTFDAASARRQSTF